MSTHKLLLGAHMSIAGGFDQALVRGDSIHCTCMQIFTKSNRQWAAKKITDQEVEQWEIQLKKSPINIKDIVAHAGYLINLGSHDKEIHAKSVNSLITELGRCHLLGIKYLVLHPGTRGKADMQNNVKNCCSIT